jgi:hypothetical protein
LNILALIALQLNHLAHLCVSDDGAIAGKLLLNDLENLLLVEFLRQPLDGGQGFTTIALCGALRQRNVSSSRQRKPRLPAAEKGQLTLDTYVDVVLRLLGFASILIGLGEGVCEAELAGLE